MYRGSSSMDGLTDSVGAVIDDDELAVSKELKDDGG